MRSLGHAPALVGEQRAAEARAGASRAAVAWIAVAYAILGSTLIVTRLVGLHRSFWTDEVVTVTDYIRAGPREILAGPYIPNNHELYSILGWATSSLVGESEVNLRLLSAIPFLLGVLLVTAWLHRRLGALSGVLFLFFATASPLLFDLSRQARGYGLAFLAMSVLIIAALEAEQTARTRELVVFFAAGLVGSLTLPNFGLAFIATAVSLLVAPALARRVVVGIAASTLVIALWYAPHAGDLLDNSQQENGAQIGWLGLPAAPIDDVLVPGVLWFSDTFLTTDPARFAVVAVAAVLLLSSPLLRNRTSALIICSGTVATLFFICATQLYVAPRFVSYLLAPLFMLLATGTAHVLGTAKRRPGMRALCALLTIGVAASAFAGAASQLLRFPGEAWKDAAAFIEASESSDAPVVAYASRPQGLRYYLSGPVRQLEASEVVATACGNEQAVVFVMQPFEVQPVDIRCLRRDEVQYFRFRQHSYGGEVGVWLVPARG